MDDYVNKIDNSEEQPARQPENKQTEQAGSVEHAEPIEQTKLTEQTDKQNTQSSGQDKNQKKFNIEHYKKLILEKIQQLIVKARNFDIKKYRVSIIDTLNFFQKNTKTMVITFCSVLFLMIVVAVAAFFSVVQGAEKVMVPNVVNKQLTDALLEMQAKELYPKIQLRYSETPGDAGKILEQNPSPGAIVKAGRRISLVVSRGIVLEHIEDYTGQILDDVRIELQTLFAGSTNPLIILAEPVYKADVANPGTILEQTPPAGTIITEPVTVKLIVSRGPEFESTRPPKIVGKTVAEMLQLMKSSKIIYDFTSHAATSGEKAGTIVQQQSIDKEFIPNYTRVTAEFAFPENSENVYGLLTDTLTNYPYPVPMKVEVQPPEGDMYTLIDFVHPGGNLTIPYAVPKDSTLILTVVKREHKRIVVK